MAKPQLNTVVLDFFSGEAGGFIVDIPRWLSVINRKSYRAGYVYSVDYLEFIGAATNVCTVVKLPETYGTLQAYSLGFEAWKKQRAEALEEGDGGLRPGKWSDFKPYYDITHKLGTRSEMEGRGIGAGGVVLQPLDTTGS